MFADIKITDVVFVIGLVVGILLTFVGWRGSARNAAVKSDPRIAAVVYGLGGFVIALITDWKRVLLRDEADGLRLLPIIGSYALGFGIGVAAALLLALVLIWLTERGRMRSAGSAGMQSPARGMLDFLFWGYQPYLDRGEAAELRSTKAALKSIAELHAQKTQLTATSAVNLAAAIIKVSSYLQKPDEATRKGVCELILQMIRSLSEPYLRKESDAVLQVNANYMLAVAVETATAEQKDSARFLEKPVTEYAYLLVLKEYAQDEVGAPHPFALPVPKKVGMWEDAVLPGATEAFLRGKSMAVGQPVSFGKSTLKKVRSEVEVYLRSQPFKSFVSLVIPYKINHFAVGVVNIESNQESVFVDDKKLLQEMENLLSPFCALLGLVLVN